MTKKLSATQQKILNDITNAIEILRKYETFEEFFVNSKDEQNYLATAYDCNGTYNTPEKFRQQDAKQWEQYEKEFYKARNEQIIMTRAKTETIKKLEALGYIEILKEAKYKGGRETIKVL